MQIYSFSFFVKQINLNRLLRGSVVGHMKVDIAYRE